MSKVGVKVGSKDSVAALGRALPSLVMASKSLMQAYAGIDACMNDAQRMAGALYCLEQAERYIANAKASVGEAMNREGVVKP